MNLPKTEIETLNFENIIKLQLFFIIIKRLNYLLKSFLSGTLKRKISYCIKNCSEFETNKKWINQIN